MRCGRREASSAPEFDLKAVRSLSEIIFIRQLNDVPPHLRWHRVEAANSPAKQQWFAAAFHPHLLLAGKEADAEQLKERLKRCEGALRQP